MSTDPTTAPPSSRTAAPAAAVLREEPINILIVDDEPKNLVVLETVLSDPSYRLVRAESADQALLALVVEEFALLILDIRMPDMNGFELAQMIKERKKTAGVPIIFLTAYYNEDQHVLEGYDTGAVDYLHKPVNPVILRSKVAVFAELHRQQRQRVVANRALLAEVTERRRVEERLRELNETLDQRVTERTAALREREHFLQRLTEVVPGVLHVFDLEERRSVFINRPVAAVLGYSDGEVAAMGSEVVGALMHPDDVPRFEEHLQRVAGLQDGEVADFEHRMRDKAGRWHWFQSRDTVFARSASGGVRQLIGAAIEVTERKQAEEALREADRRKDEFLATLAHELRNPLAPLRTGISVLKLAPAGSEARGRTLQMMDRQLNQLVHVVDDLLDVARISQGKIALRLERLTLEGLVEEAIETCRSLIEQRGHVLEVKLPGEAVPVEGDRTRLVQVLTNLLTNAAKYTEPGGRIQISGERETAEGAIAGAASAPRLAIAGAASAPRLAVARAASAPRLVIRVSDTGMGVPPHLLPSLWDLFTQVRGSLDKAQGGLGIGLSLVKKLVELHGGSVAAHSGGEGQGATFTIRLPVADDSSARDLVVQ